jgi:hypothetical protein
MPFSQLSGLAASHIILVFATIIFKTLADAMVVRAQSSMRVWSGCEYVCVNIVF